MSVVVIVPAFNAAHTLPRQLSALDSQTNLNFRVIVSDNCSTDNTKSLCAGWKPKFLQLDLVEAYARQGVAHARNSAITASTEDLILICDADDRVHPGWVEAMVRALATSSSATGPLHIIHPDQRDPIEMWNTDAVPIAMKFRGYMPGCNMGMRREVLTSVGLFDEDLSLGQEDVDFGWRITAAGLDITLAPEAVVDYYQRPGLRTLLRQQWRYGRGHVHLYDKHRHDPGIPAPASIRTSLRWFWEWAKQLPGVARRGGLSRALGAVSFEGARFSETIRRHTSSPL